MDKINGFKAAVSAVIALFTALWGWAGWLIFLWVLAMGLDYISGTAAAIKRGEWSSKVAREGLWHKLGEILAMLVAALLDIAIGVALPQIPGVPVTLEYTVFLVPLVCVWYILTEAGSVIENVGKMGAPIPAWLTKAIASLKDKVDKSAPNTEKAE